MKSLILVIVVILLYMVSHDPMLVLYAIIACLLIKAVIRR